MNVDTLLRFNILHNEHFVHQVAVRGRDDHWQTTQLTQEQTTRDVTIAFSRASYQRQVKVKRLKVIGRQCQGQGESI